MLIKILCVLQQHGRKIFSDLDGNGMTLNPDDADLIVANRENTLIPYITKYSDKKSYLIYSEEPRGVYTEKIKYVADCKVHVMSSYTKDV